MCKNSSILQSVQTGFVDLPAPIKGVSGAASLENKATAVRSVQLSTASNVDIKNGWRYTTLLPSHTNFPKIKVSSKNSKRHSCDRNKSHTEGQQLLGTTVRYSVTISTHLPLFCSPLFKRRGGVRPHYVQKTVTCTTLQ